jgi:DNA-binding Lrp family transcriptional regulator
LVSRPFAEVGARLGMAEADVIARIERLRGAGVIKRMGVVVRHRRLGYEANAMVVWDAPDARVDILGKCFARFPFVTLCYQRPRRGARWPYNLFCMIHGKDRAAVLEKVAELTDACAVGEVRHQVLFSRRCFKQRGANYRREPVDG